MISIYNNNNGILYNTVSDSISLKVSHTMYNKQNGVKSINAWRRETGYGACESVKQWSIKLDTNKLCYDCSFKIYVTAEAVELHCFQRKRTASNFHRFHFHILLSVSITRSFTNRYHLHLQPQNNWLICCEEDSKLLTANFISFSEIEISLQPFNNRSQE